MSDSLVKIRWNQATLLAKASRLFRSLGDVAADDFLKRDLAELTRSIVYKRVKTGKGVNSDSRPFALTSSVRLKPLSKNYKKYRRTGVVEFEAKKNYGNVYERVTVKINVGRPALGEFASPDKSNLTLTGQLLNSMTFDIRKYGFVVFIPATKRRGETITNAQLARYVSDNGRPFMSLTSGEIRIVKSRMRKQIQKKLRKLLK